MLIESTEQFQASTGIAIQRGANEVAESDFERLPLATRTKLRILQEHGVVRVHDLRESKAHSEIEKPAAPAEPKLAEGSK